MKKHIITLLMLSGVSMAAEQQLTLETTSNMHFDESKGFYLDDSNSGIKWSGGSSGDSLTSWKLAFTYTAAESISAPARLFGTNGGGSAAGYTIDVISTKQISFNWYDVKGIGTLSDVTVTAGQAVDIVLTFVADVKLVNDVENVVGGTYTLFASTTDANKITTSNSLSYSIEAVGSNTLENAIAASDLEYANKSRLWVTQSSIDNGEISNIALYKLEDRLIPEPTTATLSLLALCGLAARRRRK
ncbi:MAG: PEP-CTERM sorting domain-containing protein [Akkermansia sp.]|nr:PEP-CTERM sorting domain-containing protein [Akkermansia sp.]